ncbi:hypothetical protein ACFS2C_17840 [Prauserella oleivorans]|uniref:Histidine kinase n=1 Tax=Prauserella oleivorans TaxID=1478153 RepID=A0ABW5WCP7_9PSEU
MYVDGADLGVGDARSFPTPLSQLQDARRLRQRLSSRLAPWVGESSLDVELAVDGLLTVAASVRWRLRAAHLVARPEGRNLKIRIEVRGVVGEPSGASATRLPQRSLARDLLDACAADWAADEEYGRVCLWVELVLSVAETPPSLLTTSFTFSPPTSAHRHSRL